MLIRDAEDVMRRFFFYGIDLSRTSNSKMVDFIQDI
jgi:hypothetical protein